MCSPLTMLTMLSLIAGDGGAPPAHTAPSAEVAAACANLPLAFERNGGQTDERVRYLARGRGYTFFLTDTEAVLSLRRTEGPDAAASAASLRMRFAGSGARAIEALEPLPSVSNYFLGDDPAAWQADVPHFARLRYDEVAPGIDMVFYGNDGELEYDFLVAPGSDASAIALSFEGATAMRLDAAGNLVLTVGDGELTQRAPVLYQELDGGVRTPVSGRYLVGDDGMVRFEIGPHDPTRALVIDPMLIYSTFLGGTGFDWAWAMAVDASGYTYVTGETASLNFPATAGVFDSTLAGGNDCFVTKLYPNGSSLVYSTYLGGNGLERGLGIRLNGSVSFITGWTTSNNFPTTAGAYDVTFNGGYDAFVTKLSTYGSMLLYSTYLGGASDDYAEDIQLDPQNAYLTGRTRSVNFPTTAGTFDPSFNGGYDAFVTKLDALGSSLVYSTFLGGAGDDYGSDLVLDSIGGAYVTGWTWSNNFPTTVNAYDRTYNGGSDVFVTKLAATGNVLGYSTLIGGTGNDQANGITLLSNTLACIGGNSNSTNYPVTAGAFDQSPNGNYDIVVTKLNGNGSGLAFSTYIGGTGNDGCNDILFDSGGSVHMAAHSESVNFPLVNPIQAMKGGLYDAVIAKLNPVGGALLFSSFLGGANQDAAFAIGLDGVGLDYITGYSWSAGFPTTPGVWDRVFGGSSDAIVAKIKTL